MKEKAPGAWLTLSTSYYPTPIGSPLALLDDSYMLLECAQGIVQLMRDALQLSPCVDARADACAKGCRNTHGNECWFYRSGTRPLRGNGRRLDC